MKPFSLRSPEVIAKEYSGNKQKIARAAQMGMLDPTSAVLAGMFIDRMRNAQTQEAQPQSTVAQKVFSPPPSPPQPIPQAPQQGGVEALQTPFNQQSFAGGGIVAFGDGGYVPETTKERLRTEIARLRKHGLTGEADIMQRQYDAMEAGEMRPGDVRGGRYSPYNSPVESPAILGSIGRTLSDDGSDSAFMSDVKGGVKSGLNALLGKSGPYIDIPIEPVMDYFISTPEQARRNRIGNDVWKNFQPNAVATEAYGEPRQEDYTPAPMAGLGALPATQSSSAYVERPEPPLPEVDPLEKYIQGMEGLYGTSSPEREALMQYYRNQQAGQDGQKKQDMWTALAQMGFNMAGTDSPHAMQAIGQAGSSVIPTIMEMNKSRKADELAALQGRAGLEKLGGDERRDIVTQARAERRADVDARRQEESARRREKAAQDLMRLQKDLSPSEFEQFMQNPEQYKNYIEAKFGGAKEADRKIQIIRMVQAAENSDPTFMSLTTDAERNAWRAQKMAEFETYLSGVESSGNDDQDVLLQADKILGIGGM